MWKIGQPGLRGLKWTDRQGSAATPPLDEENYFRCGIHLFRMVIYRAQLEAAGDYRPTSEELESHEEIIRAAKEFLLNDTQDLRIVCHLAQISYRDFQIAMEARFRDGK